MILTEILLLLSLVCVFLFAVFKLSKQLKQALSDRVERLLRKSTDNPYLAALAGLGATALVQSSSVVTVLTITLTQAQVLPLINALGVVIGSNIGTTVTASLATIDLAIIAPTVLLIGFFSQWASGKLKKYSKAVFYTGLVLLVIELMGSVAQSIAAEPFVREIIAANTNVYLAILVGALLTGIIQSSSATTVLTVLLASQNVISIEQGIGLVLGANIGTSITGILAALPLSKTAQSVAIGHTLFNILGVILVLPLLPFTNQWIVWFGSTPAFQVAFSNFTFNVLVAVVALLNIRLFEKLVRMISDRLPRYSLNEKVIE